MHRSLLLQHQLDLQSTPVDAAPNDANAMDPGTFGASPNVQLTSMSAGVTCLMRRIIHGKLAPSGPSSGFLTSMMSAPPVTASTASFSFFGLISSFKYVHIDAEFLRL